jgi:hypothetical protein
LSIQRKLLTNVWNRRRTIALCSINGWQAQTGTLVCLFRHLVVEDLSATKQTKLIVRRKHD